MITTQPPQIVAAAALRARGYGIVWLRPGQKRPSTTDWTKRSREPNEYQDGFGLGLMTGRLSGDLICVDLDGPDALELGREILPRTEMIDGRPGRPMSHWWYKVVNIPSDLTAGPDVAGAIGGPRITHFRKTKNSGIDFLGTGGQAVVPPSITVRADGTHEAREWYDASGQITSAPGNPAIVDCRLLFDIVCDLAKQVGANIPKWVRKPSKAGVEQTQIVDKQPVEEERKPKPSHASVPATPLLLALPDRIDVARVAMIQMPSARSGRGGHDTTYAVARLLTNDCALPPDTALKLLREYNDRLGREGEEMWSESDLAHKVDSAVAAGSDPRYPFGSRVTVEPVNNPHRLAREFLGDGAVRYWRDLYLEWDGRKYVQVPDREMKALIAGHIERQFQREYEIQVARYRRKLKAWQATGKGWRPTQPKLMPVRTGLVRDVVLALNDLALLRGSFTMPCLLPDGREHAYLAVDNGLLDLESSQLRPHIADWFSNVCLPYPFDPAAKALKWTKFLERNFGGDSDRIGLIQEFFGYTLAKTTDCQSALIVHGPGGNGKSVLLAGLRAMLGAGNISTVPLEGFGQRFAMAETLGKLANVCPEVGELDKTCEGVLKSFIGGDSMLFEKKGKDPFTARPTARLVIATNNIPRFVDRSEGIWRRLLIVPMEFVIPASERTPGMDKEEFWSAELPGILNWALEGLKRLRENHWRFSQPVACQLALEEHRQESDPARLFLLERYEHSPDSEAVPAADIYSHYQLWCAQNGHRNPLNNIAFGKEIGSVFKSAKSKIARVHKTIQRAWFGLRPVAEPPASSSGGGSPEAVVTVTEGPVRNGPVSA
jgi:P4 family phage/plasmid primase-like protien